MKSQEIHVAGRTCCVYECNKSTAAPLIKRCTVVVSGGGALCACVWLVFFFEIDTQSFFHKSAVSSSSQRNGGVEPMAGTREAHMVYHGGLSSLSVFMSLKTESRSRSSFYRIAVRLFC